MRSLKAFVLGVLALGIVGYALAAALAIAAQAGGYTIHVGVGPLLFVSVTMEGVTKVTSFGPGIPVIAIVGGLANVGGARLFGHRAVRQDDRVD